jgi:tRNA A-37 threonylcarbamoyl transferase component Bud32
VDINGEAFDISPGVLFHCTRVQMKSLAMGLHNVHECGVAHQDVALRNIIMTDCGSPSAVFIDFAFASQADKDSIKRDAERFRLALTSLKCKLIYLSSIISALMQFNI